MGRSHRSGRSGRALTLACVGAIALASVGPRVVRAESDASQSADPVSLRLVTKDAGISVERLAPDGTHRPLCAAPCSETVQRRDIFVVTEDGAPAQPTFSLPETEREVTLTIRRGSRGTRITGEALLALGASAGLLTFFVVGGDPALDDMMMPQPRGPHEGTFLLAGLGGFVVAGVGLYLLLHGTGSVDSSTGRSFNLAD